MKNFIFPFFFLTIFFMLPFSVYAHPLDEINGVKLYDQKQIIKVGVKSIELTIQTTFYAPEKPLVWESIDTDKNREISEEEKNSWLNLGRQTSYLTINGQKIEFSPSSLVFPQYYDFFAPKPSQVIITYSVDYSIKSGQIISYTYNGKDKKLSQINFEALGIENHEVINLKKISDSEVSFEVREGQESQGVATAGQEKTPINSFIDKYVKSDNLSPILIIIALFGAAVLGALHALTPGHGKAIAAGYLIGTRGTIIQAVNLGLIITITHTASVFILGLAILLLTQFIVPTRIISALNIFSGLLVLVFGLFLLITRIKKYLQSRNNHNHEHFSPSSEISWKNLIPLGISGGIVPCVDAIAILIVAVSLQKIIFGLILLIAFSMGLASTLVSAGILVVVAKGKMVKRFNWIEGKEAYLGIFSALVVSLLGLALILNMKI